MSLPSQNGGISRLHQRRRRGECLLDEVVLSGIAILEKVKRNKMKGSGLRGSRGGGGRVINAFSRRLPGAFDRIQIVTMFFRGKNNYLYEGPKDQKVLSR